MSDGFYLGAYWKRRPRTLGEHLADLQHFFRELQKVDPVFSQLQYRAKSLPGFQAAVLPDLSNLSELVRQNLDLDANDCDRVDAKGRPTLDSISRIGFITSFWDGQAAAKGGLEIGINAGSLSERVVASIVIELPFEERRDEWLDLKRLFPLLETVVSVSRPAYAIVTSNAFRDAVKIDKTKATIGWLTYFADRSVAKGLPAGVEQKTTDTDGVILQLTDTRLSAQNSDQLALARRIQDQLDKDGLLEKEKIYSSPDLRGIPVRP
jgi:hypothetical protein